MVPKKNEGNEQEENLRDLAHTMKKPRLMRNTFKDDPGDSGGARKLR